MFSTPPYLVSYTALGWPLQFETPRPKDASFFGFAGGQTVQHWPDFSSFEDAQSMLQYAQQLAPNAQLFDILRADQLPPGVGRYPVPIMAHMEQPDDRTSIYLVYGEIRLKNGMAAKLSHYTGGMSDFKQGIYSMLQAQYLNLTGGATNWDRLYAYVSEFTPDYAELYWGASTTGPALGGLAV